MPVNRGRLVNPVVKPHARLLAPIKTNGRTQIGLTETLRVAIHPGEKLVRTVLNGNVNFMTGNTTIYQRWNDKHVFTGISFAVVAFANNKKDRPRHNNDQPKQSEKYRFFTHRSSHKLG